MKKLTVKELSASEGIAEHTIRTLFKTRKISGIKLGYRTLLFDPEKFREELNRFERKAVA